MALRTALIWHDEVMNDVVIEKPSKITIGCTGRPTFVIPDLGLPKGFAIVRPGKSGYLLTLGERMRGTICVDGLERDVAQFVRTNGGGYQGTPIRGKDWGVVDLDETGHHKLFFQFVPVVETAAPFFTKPVLFAGIFGYLISMAVLAGIFFWRGITVDFTLFDSELLAKWAEAASRGAAIASAALAIGGVLFYISRQEGESQASLGFSIVLHAALLFMTYQLYDGSNPFVWPGPRSLTGNYLVTRLEPEPKPEPPKPTVGTVKQETAAPKTPEKPKNTATKNPEGASGGKGEHERARDKDAKDVPPDPPKVALFEDKNRKVLDNIINNNLATNLGKFAGIKGDETRKGDTGYGRGTGTGVGDDLNGTGTTRGSKGKGSGGGGFSDTDFVSNKGKVDTGKERAGGGTCATPPCGTGAREVKVAVGEAEGDIEGLTAEEINRVVKARAGVFRACYQKELNRSPGLGGKLVIHFVIGGDGVVKSSKSSPASSLHNDGVESCVTSNIMRLKFPAKGGLSNVNYPFVFQPGG